MNAYNNNATFATFVELGDLPMYVLANEDGQSKVVDASDNFFSPKELLNEYEAIIPNGYDKAKMVAEFREWLIKEQACEPEDFD